MSDERIAELFPDPEIASRVCAIRDAFRQQYESWLAAWSENLGVCELDKQRDVHEDDASGKRHCSRRC